jgi:uncharacterized membrane-anchored protein
MLLYTYIYAVDNKYLRCKKNIFLKSMLALVSITVVWLFAFYHSAPFLSVKLLKAVLSFLDAEVHTALLAPVH